MAAKGQGLQFFFLAVIATLYHVPLAAADVPAPQIWPTQFHALLVQNFSGQLGVMDLWYDWTRGLNLHIIKNQLEGISTYDVEWTNGTSFFYDLEAKTCRSVEVGVGILRPDWLHDAEYLGVQEVDGFTCNVWEKLDFITYYEDVETKRPVKWLFYTGRQVHVITFDDGIALPEGRWQAPAYCFKDGVQLVGSQSDSLQERRQKLLPEWRNVIEQREWLLSGAMSA